MYSVAAATGLTGFIGKHFLIKLLDEYDFVISYERNCNYTVHQKDGLAKHFNAQFDLNEKFKPAVLYNLATYYNSKPQSMADVLSITESNIVFPLKVLSVLNDPNLRIINFCSYLQLLNKDIASPYMLSKQYLKVSLNPIAGEVSNVFLFDTFGSNDSRNKVVDVFIRKILNGEPIIIPSNDVRINLSDVSNICASLSPLERIPVGDSCIHSPVTLTLFDLAKILFDMIGSEVEVCYGSESECYYSSCENLPENIFKAENGRTFFDNLARRIDEIRKT